MVLCAARSRFGLFAALCSMVLSGCITRGTSLVVECPTSPAVPNARYVGPYHGIENVLTPQDYARDSFCAERFKAGTFPNGFVTVFGSSRIAEHNKGPDGGMNQANDALYQQVLGFARAWTTQYGHDYPILTGAGPGLMEAASRGATLAGGPSIGYTTYYDRAAKPDSVRPYGGDPALAFWKYAGNSLLTDGLIFTSISTRETAMIRHSAAILIAPGGTGTEWETFQILETIKSKQLAPVPIYLVGDRGRYWKSLEARIEDLVSHGAVAPNEATAPVEFVDNAEDVIQRLRIRLKLPSS